MCIRDRYHAELSDDDAPEFFDLLPNRLAAGGKSGIPGGLRPAVAVFYNNPLAAVLEAKAVGVGAGSTKAEIVRYGAFFHGFSNGLVAGSGKSGSGAASHNHTLEAVLDGVFNIHKQIVMIDGNLALEFSHLTAQAAHISIHGLDLGFQLIHFFGQGLGTGFGRLKNAHALFKSGGSRGLRGQTCLLYTSRCV